MFEIDKIYKRSDLHDQYGGNRQGGIANCANHPLIFIFTGISGEQYGYEDGWDEDNFFHYTGEGQKGDMTFTKGNMALLKHQENKKQVFLFENQRMGLWKFIDQLELVDYSYFQILNNDDTERQGIKFKFKSATEKSKNSKGFFRSTVNYNKPTQTERQGLVTSRVGQGWYRKELLNKWDNKCAVTNLDRIDILIASHIVSWKDSTDQERLDPENGILLSPNLDALFDKHLISFNDNGNIIFSKTLTKKQYELLGVNKDMKLREVTSGMKKYLKFHNQKLKENN